MNTNTGMPHFISTQFMNFVPTKHVNFYLYFTSQASFLLYWTTCVHKFANFYMYSMSISFLIYEISSYSFHITN
jgi:hypothetical protein